MSSPWRTLSADREIASKVLAPAAVVKLWEVCQIPDYRKISGQSHAELVATIFNYLMSADERIPEDWFAKQVSLADRTDGDIDTLANRIAHIRTWTFVSNRSSWLKDPEHWQGRTREIEDRLSDALHEQLTLRFVDLRTSALMKGMRDKDELTAEIAADGAINVETHFVGRLKGFRFQLDPGTAEGVNAKAMRTAAAQVVARELAMRVRRVAAAQPDALSVNRRGRIIWREEEIGQLEASDDPLKPTVTLLADEYLSGPDREKVQARLETWIQQAIADKLKPLVEISNAEDVTGLARGIAFRLRENLGVLRRESVAEEVKSLDQNARAQLRKYGVRFGAFNIYFPILLKPAAAELILTLWSLKNATAHGLSVDALPEAPRAGLTSFAPDPACPEPFYRAYGYHVCGPRAVRLDMLERLADVIRPLLAWRGPEGAMPPKGATGDGGFTVIPEMMSLLGCSPDELSGVLKALGFRLDRRPIKPALAPAAETKPQDDAVAEAAPAADAAPVEATAVEAVADVPVAEVVGETVMAEPAVADSAAAEASAAPAETPAAEAEAEIKYEDIWRPRRHHRERGERHHGRRDNRNRHAGKDQSAQPAAAATAASPDQVQASAQPAAESTNGHSAPSEKPQRRDDRRPHQGKGRREDRERGRGGEREGGQQRRGGPGGPWTSWRPWRRSSQSRGAHGFSPASRRGRS